MKCKLILVVELLVLFICVGLGDSQDSKPLPPITDALQNGAFTPFGLRNSRVSKDIDLDLVVVVYYEETLDVGYFLSAPSLVNLTLVLTACKSLPDEPLNISSLLNLTIVGQKVTHMASSFLSGLNNVEILDLDLPELQLLSLPSENQLKNLKTLKIRNVKKIEPFPKLPAMSQLELHGICERRKIKLFQNIDSLQTMVITGCGLSELPRAWVSDLSSLTVLDLRNNRLTSHGITSLAALKSLQRLNLGRNQIQDPMPQLPASLEMLILRENSIKSLTNTFFSGLNKLKWLDLSSNSIHTIENATFLPLPQIIKIDLKQNNIYYLSVSLQENLCDKFKSAAFMLENNPIRCECMLECLRNLNAKSNCKLDLQICQGSTGQSTTPSYKELESTRILWNMVDLKDHTTEGQDPSLPATTLDKDAVMERQRRDVNAGDNGKLTTDQTQTGLGQNSTHSSGNLDSVVKDNQQMSGNISTPSLAPIKNVDTHIPNVTTASTETSTEATQNASISSANNGQSTLELTTQPTALPTATTRLPTSRDEPAVGSTSLPTFDSSKMTSTTPLKTSMDVENVNPTETDAVTVAPTSLPTSDSSKMTSTTPLKTSMDVENVNSTETDAVVVNTQGTQTTSAINDVQDVEDALQKSLDMGTNDTEKGDLDLDEQVSGTKMDQKSLNKGQKGAFSVSLVVTVIIVGVMLVVTQQSSSCL